MTHDRARATRRLPEVVTQIRGRKGAVPPTDQAVETARRIIANSGNKGSIVSYGTAEVYHVKDGGQEHTVNVVYEVQHWRRRRNKLLVWPYYRARRRYRAWRQGRV